MSSHVRHGRGAVRPYVYGPPGLADFVRVVFGGVELERVGNAREGYHIETQIGDSVVVLETGDTVPAAATRASIYVYVPDVDAAFARALKVGATVLDAPADKLYAERAAGVTDAFGNVWWISTYTGAPG